MFSFCGKKERKKKNYYSNRTVYMYLHVIRVKQETYELMSNEFLGEAIMDLAPGKKRQFG